MTMKDVRHVPRLAVTVPVPCRKHLKFRAVTAPRSNRAVCHDFLTHIKSALTDLPILLFCIRKRNFSIAYFLFETFAFLPDHLQT